MGDAVPKGVFCAALTPVADDLSADVLALADHCRWLIAEGCDGVALLGTTGEANSFSVAERMRLLEGVVEAGVPAELATIYAGWRDPGRKGEVEAAQARATELRARVSRWPQIAALKAATALRTGQPGWNRLRPPLVALTPAEQEALGTALAAPLPGSAEPDRSRLAPATDDPARLEAFLPSSCAQNHAANLMPLQNGDIACVWFGGSQEGMPDISIYFARLEKGARAWSAPVKLSDDPTRSEQNPVLFPAPDRRLWLLFTAQRSGNQDTAIVRYRISEDDGRTWGPIGTLFDQPGTFVRQPVLVLDNGEWLLPIFYSRGIPGRKWVGDHDVSAVKISADEGRTWMEYPVPSSTGCVHMNVAQLGDGTLLALFRSRWADRIHASRSTDRGRTWSAPVPTELPNNNSSLQFTRLRNGHLALVFNDVSAEQASERRVSLYDEIEDDAGDAEPRAPGEGRRAFWGAPRAPLTLAISTDEGKTWPRKRNIEVGDGYCMTNNSEKKLNRELSYPSIKQTADRRIHVAFTYFRQAIKYVSVTEDWVGGGA